MRKKCFIVTPVAPDDVRQRSDLLINQIVRPALDTCNYDSIYRVQEGSAIGMIDTNFVRHLKMDDIVIAYLASAPVYYSVGVRHAIGKPIIHIKEGERGSQIKEELESLAFVNYEVMDIDYTSDTKIEKCKADLIQRVRVIERDPSKSNSAFTLSDAVDSVNSEIAGIIQRPSMPKQVRW